MKNKYKLLLLLLLVTPLIYFLTQGLEYYLTPLTERPFHALHSRYKPGGTVGHGLGILGASLMTLSLLYSMRKHFTWMKLPGTARTWMTLHTVLGTTGGLFIVLHSSGKVYGLVAVAFWAMVLVVLSGFFGRYLYSKIPHQLNGKQSTLDEARSDLDWMSQTIQRRFSLDQGQFQTITESLIPQTGKRLNASQQTQLAQISGCRGSMLRELRKALQQYRKLHRQLSGWSSWHRYFALWHVLHKPLALIMYGIMLVHVGVSIWLGYRWIFS